MEKTMHDLSLKKKKCSWIRECGEGVGEKEEWAFREVPGTCTKHEKALCVGMSFGCFGVARVKVGCGKVIGK